MQDTTLLMHYMYVLYVLYVFYMYVYVLYVLLLRLRLCTGVFRICLQISKG